MSRQLFLVNDYDLYRKMNNILENKMITDYYVFGHLNKLNKDIILIYIGNDMFEINTESIDDIWNLEALPYHILGDVDIKLKADFNTFLQRNQTIIKSANSIYFINALNGLIFPSHHFLEELNIDQNMYTHYNVWVESFYTNDIVDAIIQAEETKRYDQHAELDKYLYLTNYFSELNLSRGITKSIDHHFKLKDFVTGEDIIFKTEYYSLFLLSSIYDYLKLNKDIEEYSVSLLYDNTGKAKNKWFKDDVKITNRLKTPEISHIEFKNDAVYKKGEEELFKETMDEYQLKHNSIVESNCEKISTEKITFKRPMLFNFITINHVASKMYGVTSKQLTHILEKLYKLELITFPFTASETVKEKTLNYLKLKKHDYNALLRYDHHYISNEDFSRYISNENNQAIVPTSQVASLYNLEQLDDIDCKIYRMILKHTLYIFMTDSVVSETTYTMSVNNVEFDYVSHSIKEGGYLDLNEDISFLNVDNPLPIKKDDTMPAVLRYNKKLDQKKLLKEHDLVPFFINTYIENVKETDPMKVKEVFLKQCKIDNQIEFLYENNYLYNKSNDCIAVTPKAWFVIGIAKQLQLLKHEVMYGYQKKLLDFLQGSTYFDAMIDYSNEQFSMLIENIKNADLEYMSIVKPKYDAFFKQYDLEKEGRPELKEEPEDNDLGKCPFCNIGTLISQRKKYICNECGGYANKVIYSKDISKETLRLIMERGYSNRMSGFLNRKTGKTFEGVCVRDDIKKRINVRR